MDAMRGDMGGAACVAGSLLSISQLQLPVHIKGSHLPVHVDSIFFRFYNAQLGIHYSYGETILRFS